MMNAVNHFAAKGTRMFNKMEKHADLVTAMADKAGVDVGAKILSGQLSASGLRGAVMLCTHCQHVGDCQGHLGSAPTGDVPDYCLNKELFETLR